MVRGRTDAQGVSSFLGVPFASPPVGPARWREAMPPLPHPPLEATAFRLPCSQIPIPAGSDSFGTGKRIPTTEDCLSLNLWVPPHAPGERLPVMVWSHGGQYLRGAAAQYEGDQLARLGRVVVVTLDYRLGPMGFLAHPALTAESPLHTSGNQALFDHLQALRWLRANADRFGGDPDRITLFGESAGSATACALMGSPLAAGLFHRAILQSCACQGDDGTPPLASAEKFGWRLAKALGCENADLAAELSCMRGKTEDEVLTAIPLAKVFGDDGEGAGYRFNLDHVVLMWSPAEAVKKAQARMPVMLGTTENEMDRYVGGYGVKDTAGFRALIAKEFPRFAEVVTKAYPVGDAEDPTKQLGALFSDEASTCPVRRDAVSLSSQGYPTYYYRFRHVLDVMGGKMGAFHGSELAYLFPSVFRKLDFKYKEGDLRLAELISGYWGRFAATGDPNGGGGAPSWPRYDAKTDPFMVLDDAPSVGTQLRRDQCDLWDRVEGPGSGS